MKWPKTLLCLLCAALIINVFPSLSAASKKDMHVTFIAVASPEEKFWGDIIAIAQAAADDLNIDFEILYAERNHIKAIQLMREICNRQIKPDYVIVVGEKKIGGTSLALADEAEINTMLFGDITAKEHEKYGYPRQKLPHWLGQRKIDDYDLGRNTAQAIIDQAILNNQTEADGTLNILGLAGVAATTFSDERVRGLRDAVANNHNVRLLQVVNTDWSKADGYKKSLGLLNRYQRLGIKKIGAIWACLGSA